MANQAIALQARAPQTDILGPSMARNAQMINMMMQQRAAERQAAQAQQQMQLAQTKEAREARTSDLEYQVNAAKFFRQMGKAVGDDATYQAWLSRVEKISPDDAAAYRAFSPNYDPDKMDQIIMDVEQYINKKIATPVASFQVSDKGVPQSVTSGGTAPSVKEIPQFRYEEDQPPAAAPTPPKLRQPTTVAPEALDAAAAAIAEGKYMDDPRLKGLPPEALDEAQKRAMQLRLDTMPPVEGRMQPMSAQQGQPDLAQVVNDMMATGFVTQSNLEAMRQVAGPDKDAQLSEILRSNNIQIVPDEGADQFRSAVYRPEQGVGMQEVGYVPTTTRFKPATQGAVPGEYSLPTSEIQRRERAKRETPAEAAAKAAAVKQAEIREEQLKAKSDQKRAAENFFKVIGVNPRSKDDPVARLIKQSTSGALEAIGAELVGAIPSEFGGGATEGAKAIGELETIAAKLTNDLLGGKLGTGISNEDRKMIERMVGDIQDPFIPAEKRLAAWNRVKQIQAAYLGNAATNKPSTGRVVRTGTVNGRRVVQYSDGRIEYAD